MVNKKSVVLIRQEKNRKRNIKMNYHEQIMKTQLLKLLGTLPLDRPSKAD
jgi:hypothetical protein